MLGCTGQRPNAVHVVVTTGRLDAIRCSDGRRDLWDDGSRSFASALNENAGCRRFLPSHHTHKDVVIGEMSDCARSGSRGGCANVRVWVVLDGAYLASRLRK